jgi:hypothetical protein
MERKPKKSASWLDIFSGIVAANPKMSALIAFELGRMAGRTTLDATDKYKALKPRINEARDYILAQMPNISGAAQFNSLKLLHAPDLQPKKRVRTTGRKKKTQKKAVQRNVH